MSAIHIDVLTSINEASAAAASSQLEAQFGEAGRKVAEAFAANADLGGKVKDLDVQACDIARADRLLHGTRAG